MLGKDDKFLSNIGYLVILMKSQRKNVKQKYGKFTHSPEKWCQNVQ